MEYVLIVVFMLLMFSMEVACYCIEIKYQKEVELLKNKRLIKRLVRKYMRSYKKEIKNSRIISMKDYVIDLVQADKQFKEIEYVKKITYLYESERQYHPIVQ